MQRFYSAYPAVGAAKLISVLGLIIVTILAILTAVGYMVMFPRQPRQWFIVYNVIALLLMLAWLVTLMHGAFKPSLRALSISIIFQFAVIGCCLALAFMIFLGLYYDEAMQIDSPPLPEDVASLMRPVGAKPDGGLEEVVDMPSLSERNRPSWPLSYSKTALTAALLLCAVIQMAILGTTMKARAAVRRALVPTNTVELR